MDESKLKKLREALNNVHDWPSLYMFKFIVPSDNEKIAKVEALFNSKTAEIRLTQSSKGNYTSVTAREVMTSAQKVIDCYMEASKIEGLIAL
jgi:hypothetical protein